MLLETFKQEWDFELLDSGKGFRLEKWGEAVLARPDPQVIWPRSLPDKEWQKAWATFRTGSAEDKGKWEINQPLPHPWIINFKDTRFLLKPSPFKHTGIFAEQAAQWEWMRDKISNFQFPISKEFKNSKITKLKILNLFAYTGGATMVLSKAGCHVTHVDASKPAITWANENYKLNQLPADSVRWILDDAVKFVKREIKRGVKYDGIIMDPPAFGRSPTGKVWKFNQDMPQFLEDCISLLSPNARFLLINAYATNSSALALNNLLEDAAKNLKGKIEFGELCLKQKTSPPGAGLNESSRLLSTGIFARWNQ